MKRIFLNLALLGCLASLVVLSPAAAQQALPDMQCPPAAQRVIETTTPAPQTESLRLDASRYNLSNGIDIILYDSGLLASHLTYLDGVPILPLDDGRYLSVITDIDDPEIYNKGDGSFHPFIEDNVVEIIKGISHPHMDIEVEVYLLPYPRRNLLVSSASGNTIFLSPHVLDINPAVCAYIVAHEMGHVFQSEYMPGDSRLWERYRSIRGITDETKFSEWGTHSYRPTEIFAEDFRVLCGGSLAAYGGVIENPELQSPLYVTGLDRFISGIGGTSVAAAPKVRATCYPNPFNPETEIRITMPDEIRAAGGQVAVRIYDVRGSLVRELVSDVPNGDDLYIRWNGRDRHGTAVASAHYFAMIEAGSARTTLKLVLLK